jgi:spore coat protein CotH
MKPLAILTLLLAATAGAVVDGQVRRQVFGVTPTPQTGSNADAFFDDTVLHEVRLTINTRDWQSLKDNFLDNTYYTCDLRWRDHVARNIGIRSRGTGSRSGVKPGLRVDFDRYVTDQKFLGLKSFVLRNNTQDASNMHERLSMLLFRKMNLLAPREAHTRLYINSQYVGLYTIVESADKPFLKRNLDEDEGYLYKYDYPSDGTPYFFQDKGSDPAAYVPLPFKPETHEADSRPDVVAQWIQTVNLSSNAAFRGAVGDYLDFGKFLQHVAVETFVAETDGFVGDYGVNNFYIYRSVNQNRFTFIGWDKSEAFKGGPTRSIWQNIRNTPTERQNRLVARILGYRDMYDYFLDMLLECARLASEPTDGDSRGWLEREIEREYQQIRDAAVTDPDKPYTADDFERAVNDLREFAQNRSSLVTQEVNSSR